MDPCISDQLHLCLLNVCNYGCPDLACVAKLVTIETKCRTHAELFGATTSSQRIFGQTCLSVESTGMLSDDVGMRGA
jgi:hypothetical protein